MGKVGTVISFGMIMIFCDLKKMVAVDIQAISGGKGLQRQRKYQLLKKRLIKIKMRRMWPSKSKSPKVDQPRKRKWQLPIVFHARAVC